MKKLVLLSAFLSPYRSGAEAMVEEVSVRLTDSFDVVIITGRHSRKQPKQSMLGKNVRVVRVGFGFRFDKWLFPLLAPFAARKQRPDIVHAVLESYAGLALVVCRFLMPKTKRVLTLQSTNTSFLLGRMHHSAHVITAISSVLMERAKKFGRTDIVLIPNGIDLSGIRTALQSNAKDSGRVLFVGRLEQMKGVDVLLRAFAKAIKGLSPSVHLRIVGDGSEKTSLQKLSAELEIDHRVTFTGRITDKNLFAEYAKAEIFVGLSRSEALGNVFLEAQAAKCAVLAARTGGIPDIVLDGRTGLLVENENVDEAATALRSLLSDVSLRARLSVEAQRHAEKYGWEGVAKRYSEILTGL